MEPLTALRLAFAPEMLATVPPPGHIANAEVVAFADVPTAPDTVVEETKVLPEGVSNFTLYEPGNSDPNV